MSGFRPIGLAAFALVLAGTASIAHADEAKAGKVTVTSRETADRNQWGLNAGRKSMQWDASKGRWGVQLDMDQTSRRGVPWQDVQAGAYFKVTPSLRVGGGVALGEAANGNPKALVQEPAPRVRLETAFKF